jgi:hypothetical protein
MSVEVTIQMRIVGTELQAVASTSQTTPRDEEDRKRSTNGASSRPIYNALPAGSSAIAPGLSLPIA